MDIDHQLFNFHNIAEVEISTDSSFASSFFTSEYQYHLCSPRSSGENSQDTQINIPNLSFEFRQNNSSLGGFTHHNHKFFARWNYQINIDPHHIDIHVNGNQISISMVHHMLVHPSLRYLASGNNHLLLHAGAVVKNNKSLIFTGKGGTGKTTTTSLILASDQGWQVHADDYVFLGNGQSQAYITRSHLYRDLQRWIPQISKRLTRWERIRLEVLGEIRQDTHEKIKWPVRIEPQRLWPNAYIANTATPAAIVLLDRDDIPQPSLMKMKNLDETVADLIDMNFGEARHFIHLLRKSGALDENWLNSWKETETTLITNILKKTPIFRLVLPFTGSTHETQNNLLPILEELVS